jgi:hypothetical protein
MTKITPHLRRDLTLEELENLQNLLICKDHYLDELTSYAGYFLQMKLYGTMTFRILHSHATWIKVRRELVLAGLDVDSLPEWTALSEKVRGVRWYKNDLLKAKDVWTFLVGINRRGNKELGAVDNNT